MNSRPSISRKGKISCLSFVVLVSAALGVPALVQTQGIITTGAGNGTADFSGDNGPATSASMHSAVGLAVDDSGNVFIADQGYHRIGQVAPAR